MKKRSFFAIFVMAATLAVAAVSCKKEKHGETTEKCEQCTQEIGNMDEYLMAFKKKLLSAEKGGEAISLEQAERDLGNLLNFDFGDANFVTDEIKYDTLYVPVMFEGSLVGIDQLASTYNTAFASILEAYNRVDLREKSVLFISCSINQDTRKGEGVDARFVLATRGLSRYEPTHPIFDETDNWRVWEKLGKCDGTCVGDDHTTILEKTYYRNLPSFGCINGRIYYTDFGGGCIMGADYQEENLDLYYYNYGYQFWCGSGSEVMNHCVEYPEMQYYYNNLCQVLDTRKPQGHAVMSIDCYLDFLVGISPEAWYDFFCDYTTGKPNCTNEGPAY